MRWNKTIRYLSSLIITSNYPRKKFKFNLLICFKWQSVKKILNSNIPIELFSWSNKNMSMKSSMKFSLLRNIYRFLMHLICFYTYLTSNSFMLYYHLYVLQLYHWLYVSRNTHPRKYKISLNEYLNAKKDHYCKNRVITNFMRSYLKKRYLQSIRVS